MKHQLFHAGVVFARILVNQTLKEKSLNFKNPQYFGRIKLGPNYAKYLLKQNERLHDNRLVENGQFGMLHRCNDAPFNIEMETRMQHEKQMRNSTTVLDRKTLLTFQKKLGEMKKLYYNTAINRQGDALCNGNLIRVKFA